MDAVDPDVGDGAVVGPCPRRRQGIEVLLALGLGERRGVPVAYVIGDVPFVVGRLKVDQKV